MRLFSKNAFKPLFIPGGVLLALVAVIAHSGWLSLAPPALSFLYYCALLGGLLLAWRFHSSRSFFALLVLFFADQAISLFSAGHFWPGSAGYVSIEVAAIVVPLNFVLISLMHERGFSLSALVPLGILLFVEFTVMGVLCRGAEISSRRIQATAYSLPDFALVLFAATLAFLAIRFCFTHKPVDSALLWSLSAFFLSLRFVESSRLSSTYAVAAAVIVAASIVENSYLLAYHDELTTLASRRAFNDEILRLQSPYSIAVIDIDHFKRFNDTYGHDTGDQVLRLVAAHLARVRGGGQAYRCGGEEFNILFPGKTTDEVVDHLEALRVAVETAEFRVRGGERRQEPRGPDRRNQRARGRARKADAIRELARESDAPLSVTISIGVATGSKPSSDPQLVLQAADKALYRAKQNGRNRLETAAKPKRPRTKAAGIA